jgi:hypothetical protein
MQTQPVGPFSAENRPIKNDLGVIVVYSPGSRQPIRIKVNGSVENISEPKLAERIADIAIDFANSTGMSFKSSVQGPRFNLIVPDAGGRSVGSIFSMDLGTIDGKKRLYLTVSRDDDPGTDTVCISWINYSRETWFADTFRKCVKDLLEDGAQVLRQRAYLRRSFDQWRFGQKEIPNN